MDDEQIWAQLDLRAESICRILDYILEGELTSPDLSSNNEDSVEEEEEEEEEEVEEEEEEEERLQKALETLKRDEDIDLDEFLVQYGLDGSDSQDLNESSSESYGEEEEEMQEDIFPLRDPSSSEQEDTENQQASSKKSRKRKREELSELEDGFFDLAEFNAYTENAEAKSSSRGRLGGDDSDENEEEIDIFASVGSHPDLGDSQGM